MMQYAKLINSLKFSSAVPPVPVLTVNTECDSTGNQVRRIISRINILVCVHLYVGCSYTI